MPCVEVSETTSPLGERLQGHQPDSHGSQHQRQSLRRRRAGVGLDTSDCSGSWVRSPDMELYSIYGLAKSQTMASDERRMTTTKLLLSLNRTRTRPRRGHPVGAPPASVAWVRAFVRPR